MRISRIAVAAIVSLTATMTATVFAASAGKWIVGSKADIAGVTAAQKQVWGANPDRARIMGMHVVGDYALDVWSELHMCCPSAVFKRVSADRWKRVTGSAGDSPLPMSYILKGGVPEPIVHQLCSGWPKGYGPCL
jgi:hypothetical protein